MYSCIKKVVFQREGFPDVDIREMFDDITKETVVQVKGSKSNHAQSGYHWTKLSNGSISTYRKWLKSPPEDVTVIIL